MDENKQAYLDIIQTYSVYTHARAHLRWGEQGHCPKCSDPIGDWKHYADECLLVGTKPHMRPPTDRCLRYAGCVPSQLCRAPLSLQQGHSYVWGPPASGTTMLTVATDGGCVTTPAGPRAWRLPMWTGLRPTANCTKRRSHGSNASTPRSTR